MLQAAAVGLSQIPHPCTCDRLVWLPLVQVASALTACILSSCGGRRKNVSHLHQPKGSAACVSIRAYLGSNQTLCGGGWWSGGGQVGRWMGRWMGRWTGRRPPTSSGGSGPVEAHRTLQVGDRWFMLKNETLHMGRDSKIRPIFVLYEWCIVTFFLVI